MRKLRCILQRKRSQFEKVTVFESNSLTFWIRQIYKDSEKNRVGKKRRTSKAQRHSNDRQCQYTLAGTCTPRTNSDINLGLR